ncbi:MAG: hypothetical protein WC939_00970 [Acholeplasmataceae bacterium]
MTALYVIMIILGVIIIGLGFFIGIKLSKNISVKNKHLIEEFESKHPSDLTISEINQYQTINMKKTFSFVGMMLVGFLIGGGLAIAGLVLLLM